MLVVKQILAHIVARTLCRGRCRRHGADTPRVSAHTSRGLGMCCERFRDISMIFGIENKII